MLLLRLALVCALTSFEFSEATLWRRVFKSDTGFKIHAPKPQEFPAAAADQSANEQALHRVMTADPCWDVEHRKPDRIHGTPDDNCMSAASAYNHRPEADRHLCPWGQDPKCRKHEGQMRCTLKFHKTLRKSLTSKRSYEIRSLSWCAAPLFPEPLPLPEPLHDHHHDDDDFQH